MKAQDAGRGNKRDEKLGCEDAKRLTRRMMERAGNFGANERIDGRRATNSSDDLSDHSLTE